MKRIVVALVITTMLLTSSKVTAFPVSGNFINIKGGAQEPFSQFDGKVVLMEAFATWCAPCKQEFHEMSKINSVFGENLTLLSISVDPSDTVDKVRVFKADAENLFTFQATWDIGLAISGQNDQQGITYTLGIDKIPTTLLISAKGDVVKKWIGVVNAAEIGSYIDANVTFPMSNPTNDLITQITGSTFFQLFMVVMLILISYQIFIPKKKVARKNNTT